MVIVNTLTAVTVPRSELHIWTATSLICKISPDYYCCYEDAVILINILQSLR